MTVWKGKNVVLHTTLGDMTIELFEDMPITAGNFAKLLDKGFYDGTVFHRVIDKFMIQGETRPERVWEVRAMKSRMSSQSIIGTAGELSL